jgi:small-conductance mechanosensitive channel
MPFQFPDPTVQTEVVHPVTGETWHYHEGAWEVEDSHTDPAIPSTHSHPATHAAKSIEQEVDQNEEQLQALSTTLFNLVNKVDSLESLDLNNALSALATAQADIIELKSKVNTLELTSFLIME